MWTPTVFASYRLDRDASAAAAALSRLALVGLLCSYFIMSHDGVRVTWMTYSLPFVFVFTNWQGLWRDAKDDVFPRLALLFLSFMTFRSFLALDELPLAAVDQAGTGLLGTLLLGVFCLLTWQSGAHLRALDQMAWWVGVTAAFAALISMVVFYALLPGHVVGERLCNWFVYQGLNPVCTGLTMGFASLWLACVRERYTKRRERLVITLSIVILLVAVFFTRSRGALLALTAGYGVLLAIRGFHRVKVPLLALVFTALCFQCSGPLVSHLSTLQVQARSREAMEKMNDPQFVGPVVVFHNPAREMFHRWDSGRFEIYAAGIGALKNWQQWLFGIGQWGTRDLWAHPLVHSTKFLTGHLHSAFLATLVHGGVFGLALFGALLLVGLQRAYRLVKVGEDTWLVLLVFGCTALLFDGETFTSFTSLPKFEALVVTFPLVVAASAWRRRSRLPA